MSNLLHYSGMLFRLLPQIALLALLLGAPVLATANTNGGGPFIEHAQKKNSGFGFVLLVSLQR